MAQPPSLAQRATAGRPPRIHVVGSSPRSGTTLMFELLTSCFQVEKFGDHEISLFSTPSHPRDVFVSKKPTDFIHVCRVLRWDPMLHVIYMQRDPRDVVTSRHNKEPDRYWCDFNVWRRNENLLPRLAGNPRLFACRYEDLVADPDRIQADLQARFGFLRQLHAFSEFDKVNRSSDAAKRAMNGVRQISTDSIGKWRENLPRLAAQVSQFPDLPQRVVDAGYETDPAWAGILAEIVPDQMESVRKNLSVLRGKSPVAHAVLRGIRRLGTLAEEARYISGFRRKI